jgi:hypothetical protein
VIGIHLREHRFGTRGVLISGQTTIVIRIHQRDLGLAGRSRTAVISQSTRGHCRQGDNGSKKKWVHRETSESQHLQDYDLSDARMCNFVSKFS